MTTKHFAQILIEMGKLTADLQQKLENKSAEVDNREFDFKQEVETNRKLNEYISELNKRIETLCRIRDEKQNTVDSLKLERQNAIAANDRLLAEIEFWRKRFPRIKFKSPQS